MLLLLNLPVLAQTPPATEPLPTAPGGPETTGPPPIEIPAVQPAPAPQVEQAALKIGGYTVLTLRGPGSNERMEQAQARFESAVRNASQPRLVVEVRGSDRNAILFAGGRGILAVTPEDALANGSTRVLPLAQVWGARLRAILANPTVLRQIFLFSGLPASFTFNGSEFVRGSGAVSDVGRFTTDGVRTAAEGRTFIVFWDSQIPAPYTTVYLLNRFREYVPYSRP